MPVITLTARFCKVCSPFNNVGPQLPQVALHSLRQGLNSVLYSIISIFWDVPFTSFHYNDVSFKFSRKVGCMFSPR